MKTAEWSKRLNTSILVVFYAEKIVHLKLGPEILRSQIVKNQARNARNLLTHHHTIRVYVTCYADSVVCFVLQPAADRGDLMAFLQAFCDEIEGFNADNMQHTYTSKAITLKTAFEFLASGLAFMQTGRIRHKDIKCKSILMHQGTGIYTDFGLSKDFSQAESSTTEGPFQALT
jgi:serine/threonine protein kinase